MTWTKHGLIYVPRGRFGWDRSHAAVPTVDVLDDRRWRIYYAARDADNRSHTSYLDVAAGDPERILHEHPQPILPLGPLGAFDDCGIMPSWIVAVDEATRYLYYIGCTTRRTVPYHNSIGLAVSRDGGRTFAKLGAGPLFGPTLHEPYFASNPCVLADAGHWRCWYLSCLRWEMFAGIAEPFYHIKYAESSDGISWRRSGTVAVELSAEEAGLARPSVLRGADGYRMWYCRRKLAGYRTERDSSYRLGYAESADGIRWQRKDELAGIDVALEGWDADMICYPQVIAAGRLFLFYNGNGFGRSGLGYATLEHRPRGEP